MYKVIYSENSLKDLEAIDITIAKRIVKKVDFFSKQKNVYAFCKKLRGFGDDKYRFRIGDYRVIFKIGGDGEVQILMILNVKHRREVYLQKSL